MRTFLSCAVVGVAALTSYGESADYTFVPPAQTSESKTGPVAKLHLTPMLEGDYSHFTIDTYAGQSKALREQSSLPEMQVGVGVELDWSDTPLFSDPTRVGDEYHWRASLQSIDATALRLQVDLSRMRPDASLWVVDLIGNRPFGPYTFQDAQAGGLWLPTTIGDRVVVWVSTTDAIAPDVAITALSHCYEPVVSERQKQRCPIAADCITNTALREVSTGIGRLSITDSRGTSAVCSGALINNAITERLETYFLTADHCFQNYPGSISARDLEVIWDFRAEGCDGSSPSTASLSQLPRSSGDAFLGNSSTLDGMLIRLSFVPVGTRGRAYLGWDTRTPVTGERVVGLHHPSGNAMRECIGVVSQNNVNTSFGQKQTSLIWSDGLTEKGSSGSPSLFSDGTFRIFGMLSNGNSQSCNNDNERIDQYSSFRDFFLLTGGFLTSETPPSTGRTLYDESEAGNGDGGALASCVQQATTSAPSAGDTLIGALALLSLAGWSRLRQ